MPSSSSIYAWKEPVVDPYDSLIEEYFTKRKEQIKSSVQNGKRPYYEAFYTKDEINKISNLNSGPYDSSEVVLNDFRNWLETTEKVSKWIKKTEAEATQKKTSRSITEILRDLINETTKTDAPMVSVGPRSDTYYIPALDKNEMDKESNSWTILEPQLLSHAPPVHKENHISLQPASPPPPAAPSEKEVIRLDLSEAKPAITLSSNNCHMDALLVILLYKWEGLFAKTFQIDTNEKNKKPSYYATEKSREIYQWYDENRDANDNALSEQKRQRLVIQARDSLQEIKQLVDSQQVVPGELVENLRNITSQFIGVNKDRTSNQLYGFREADESIFELFVGIDYEPEIVISGSTPLYSFIHYADPGDEETKTKPLLLPKKFGLTQKVAHAESILIVMNPDANMCKTRVQQHSAALSLILKGFILFSVWQRTADPTQGFGNHYTAVVVDEEEDGTLVYTHIDQITNTTTTRIDIASARFEGVQNQEILLNGRMYRVYALIYQSKFDKHK